MDHELIEAAFLVLTRFAQQGFMDDVRRTDLTVSDDSPIGIVRAALREIEKQAQ